jgi:hypothetical protein
LLSASGTPFDFAQGKPAPQKPSEFGEGLLGEVFSRALVLLREKSLALTATLKPTLPFLTLRVAVRPVVV